MPFVKITTWPTKPEVKKKMMEEVTRVIHQTSGAPLDKISVVIQEIEQASWCEAGVLGCDPEFREKSRRREYEGGI